MRIVKHRTQSQGLSSGKRSVSERALGEKRMRVRNYGGTLDNVVSRCDHHCDTMKKLYR